MTSVESADVWAFLTVKSVEDVLAAIGRRAYGGGYILGAATDQGTRPKPFPLEVLHTHLRFLARWQLVLNGQATVTDLKMVAVGLGALGSKLQLSLARAGFGKWTFVDEDVLLPHNLARYQYEGFWIGRKKVEIAFSAANMSLYEEEPPEVIFASHRASPRSGDGKTVEGLGCSKRHPRHVCLGDGSETSCSR